MHGKLTDDELSSLQAFLDKPGLGDTSMGVATMEGYFAALAIGPRTLMPSQWLPWVWDMDEGEAEPPFDNVEAANALMQLIFRQYNGVVSDFMDASKAFRPLYKKDSRWSPLAWCEGFMLCVELGEEDWAPLQLKQRTWLEPFIRLGTAEGLALTDKRGDAEVWLAQILPSLKKIHAHWLKQRVAEPAGEAEDGYTFGAEAPIPSASRTPKVGRNAPCPCGSGKKFKQCCGAASGTVH